MNDGFHLATFKVVGIIFIAIVFYVVLIALKDLVLDFYFKIKKKLK